MKLFLAFFFLCCVFFSKAQTKETYQTETGEGHCPATLLLYSNSVFVYQSGCESAPELSFGKWTKSKETIKLEPVSPQSYAVIKSVTANTVPGDSIWLAVVDKDGTNLTAKISVGLEITGRGSYLFGNDASGTKKFVFKRSGGKIVFRTLNKLFGQRLELPTDTANNFLVTLNLSSEWINSSHATWNSATPLLFLKKGETLQSVSKNAGPLVFRKPSER